MIVLYIFFLLVLSIYGYALVDPNLTLINSPFWTQFRNVLVYLGYYQRQWSWVIYLILIIILFFFSFYFVKHSKKIKPLRLALIIGILLLLSYPFLSHDFFNYLFDAKILTFYGKNPYLYKALDFSSDPWLRFMHWTHRTYPYGPVFLLITLVPSFFSFGKFIISFFLFKITWLFFYLLAVYYLNKLNKKWAIIFTTHPLILIEGLVNAHNDLIATSLAIIGIYYLFKEKNLFARLLLLLSGGIKYITLPLIFLVRPKTHPRGVVLILIGLLIILGYLTFFSEIQPWYFLVLFVFLPYFEKLVYRLNIFFLGLLLSYYPYIRLGGWDSVEKLSLKHIIILAFSIINLIYFLWFSTKHEQIS
ncbi:hypothetical protein COS31_05185 [Candidatus Roizmanbacteria bacterium CG02_land_8_20_14_3_00_36_15]|uniref:DUF2029 domain-containing protein n=2 Tax=Candidatus Roizmaniibacteriota TaxID=1752723 RepID=A0A2M8KK51_9BACT|nr:MAG: hypothetical protein COS51_02385 [Candidatus Roizmanbacteria bacterium CG03_land_8_20_14_0_80_36_21]PIV37325.1 MAG: hypothetical protein COS31_05185 [Candidatus Roizmanbacteria bacterium CG02_land_8_20_14_3_00_36_15]PIY69777.1 MAG: hypothetical protein COY89_04655 [Candidatus Roizmanbacteria bacterium CG_4_10_14_0_8_um_filter_36_36]PJA53154.1 MAG: hypothetical protein CO166_02785 [Candidatus Roizmanbacteria bacterium CG_4_9_14_3_um_filter_36_11]PJC81930.1 MAG: hypothetical protein CO007